MAKRCLAHPDRPAATMCHHCHKPVCASCTVVQPSGQFCSTECGVLFRDYRDRAAAMKTEGGRFGRKIVVLLVAVVLVTFAVGVVFRYGVIGRLIKQTERLKR